MTVCILLLALTVTPADYAAAEADRAQYPQSEWSYLYYASSSHLTGDAQTACDNTLAFVVASSSSQQIAEKRVPVKVSDGLYRLNTADLKWDARLLQKLLVRHPYSRVPGGVPLVFRADWIIEQLSDTTEGTGYYELLYGTSEINRDAFLKFWGVNVDPAHAFGVIVNSKDPLGPSVAKRRVVKNHDTDQRTSAWGTNDFVKITAANDPLEHLDGKFNADAEEYLVGMPIVSLETGERGTLIAYFLANGKGARQEEAPANIVTDHLGFRGQSAIRNFGSCVGCHAEGFLDPGVSELRQYIKGNEAGIDVFASPKKLAEQIELFHLSDAGKQLARDNEDFTAGLAMVNGLSGKDNAAAFKSTIDAYDADVTLRIAARELHVEPRTLRNALGYYNQNGGKVSARLAGLADEQSMPRTRWEEEWYTGYLAVQAWGKK